MIRLRLAAIYILVYEFLKIIDAYKIYPNEIVFVINALSALIILICLSQILTRKTVLGFVGYLLLIKLSLFSYTKSPETIPIALACLTLFTQKEGVLKILFNIYIFLIYIVSAIMKLLTPSWISGDALRHLMTGIFSTSISQWILNLVDNIVFWRTISYLTVGLYFFSIFLLFSGAKKTIVNSIFILFHICIFAVLDLKQVSLGMILVHIFIFDDRSIRNLFYYVRDFYTKKHLKSNANG